MLRYSPGQSLTDAIIGELLDEAYKNDLWDLAVDVLESYDDRCTPMTPTTKGFLIRDLRNLLRQHGL